MIILAFVTFVGVAIIHYATLSSTVPRLIRTELSRGLQHGLLVTLIGVLHVFEAMIYAGAFELGQYLGLGGFKPAAPLTFMDVYYFSLVNYTTLGLGDIYPFGHLRFLAGVESLGGFLLLSCSASYLFTFSKPNLKD